VVVGGCRWSKVVEGGCRWLGLDFEVVGRYRGVLAEERRERLEDFICGS